jgi:hypothetical protein
LQEQTESVYYWHLGGTIRHEDGWIVLEEPRIREVKLGPEKLVAFAGVRDLAAALQFAKQYGLLDRHSDGGPYRESFADWQEEAGRLAGLLSQYIDLQRSGEGRDEGEQAYQDARRLAAAIDEGRGDARLVFSLTWLFQHDPSAVDEVAWMGRFQDRIMDGPLRSVLYYELGELVKRGDELRRCEDCGRAFLVGDPRQRFCDATCNYRTRRRRMNERKREASAPVDGGTAAD